VSLFPCLLVSAGVSSTTGGVGKRQPSVVTFMASRPSERIQGGSASRRIGRAETWRGRSKRVGGGTSTEKVKSRFSTSGAGRGSLWPITASPERVQESSVSAHGPELAGLAHG